MTEFQSSDTCDEHLKLLESIAGLPNRPEFHDVTFICKDGIRVAANRVFLALRCKYFDRLLFGNLAESNQAEICLPSTSSASLHLIFEFLHTCKVHSLRLDSMAVEAYDLARQYDLPGLQKLIVDFLVRNAREACTNVGLIISSALKLRASDVAEQLLPVASTALELGNSNLFHGFSVDALVFALEHESLRAGKPFEMDVFNAVLSWALERYTSWSGWGDVKDGDMMQETWPKEVLGSLRGIMQEAGSEEAKDWVRVLQGVRFECIPTHELEGTIEQLGLVPMDLLLKAYRAQAQRFAAVALKATLWDSQCKGSDVRIEQDLCRFESKTHQGARTQASFTTGIHSWKILIENYCDLVWVGVVDDTVDMEEWLGKQPGGWMYGSNGTLCHSTSQDNGPYTNKYGCVFREAVVEVKLNMHSRELGFVVDGVDCGVAFRNVGPRVYPAVSCRAPGLIKVAFGDKLWSMLEPL